MKELLKRLLCLLHISITRNQRYDAYTRKIIRRSLNSGSNCIDIGCHKGEILDLMIRNAPDGRKFGFEPIPALVGFLNEKYKDDPTVTIHQVALYDQAGETTFQHVLNAPAYSGIKKRRYDGKVEIEQITVKTVRLDDIMPEDLRINLIKIDVEGAEFKVMLGGEKTISRNKPVIIFEFGMGAADFYGSEPGHLYEFLTDRCGLKISTLRGYLGNRQPLTSGQFIKMYEQGSEYYFVGHP